MLKHRPLPMTLVINERGTIPVHFQWSILFLPQKHQYQPRILLFIWIPCLIIPHSLISVSSWFSSHISTCIILAIPLTIEGRDRPSHGCHDTTRKNRQIVVEIPDNIDLPPGVIFRYLAEKLTDASDDQDTVTSHDYLFRPIHKGISSSASKVADGNHSRPSISPLDHSTNDSRSSSEVN